MSKSKEKRQALGDKYIGKHGTNKPKGSARGKHNKKKLAALNAKHGATWRTLTQAQLALRTKTAVPAEKRQQQQQSGDVGDAVMEYIINAFGNK
jgi:hypothetical protein